MAYTLPTRTVTDTQATRISAAFGGPEGYLKALDEWLITSVMNSEIAKYDEQQRIAREAKMAEIQASIKQ